MLLSGQVWTWEAGGATGEAGKAGAVHHREPCQHLQLQQEREQVQQEVPLSIGIGKVKNGNVWKKLRKDRF